jgi:hypothetical protein
MNEDQQDGIPGISDEADSIEEARQWLRAEADKLISAGARRIPGEIVGKLLPKLLVRHAVAMWRVAAVKELSPYLRGGKETQMQAASLGNGQFEYIQMGLFTEAQLLASLRRKLTSSESLQSSCHETARVWLEAHPDDPRTVSDLLRLAVEPGGG